MFELFIWVKGEYRCVASGTLNTVAIAQHVLWQGGVNSWIKEV